MLIKCPECGKQISDKVEACPNCGAPQPASLRTAALEKRGVARSRTIRIVATIVIVTAVAAATAFSFVYRWPVSYEVGTVTGTDTVSREDLVKAVDGAAAGWNSAAGRTVAWRLPLGKRVRFDVEINADLQEYLTTLRGLELYERAVYAEWKRAQEALSKMREAYAYSLFTPTMDWSRHSLFVPASDGAIWWKHLEWRRPTLSDVERYERASSAAADTWQKRYNSVEAFKKTAEYTDDPASVEAGVVRTEGSPTTVLITAYVNSYSWANIISNQFGHILLGTLGANNFPSSVTAAPLKSPWKLHLFGATNP